MTKNGRAAVVHAFDFKGLEVVEDVDTISGRPINHAERVTVIAHHSRCILDALGLQVDHDPNLEDTPTRFARAMLEFVDGMYNTNDRVAGLMKTVFPSDYDEMIIQRRLRTTGLCPHHLQQITYSITVGYLPNKKTHLCIGLSKVPRLCALLSARPVLQEQLTREIAQVIETYLDPQGVGVIIRGEHGCMTGRGALQRDSDTLTSELRGAFREHPQVRSEFMAYGAPPPK